MERIPYPRGGVFFKWWMPFLDGVLYADNTPKSINATSYCSDSAFAFSHHLASSFIPAPFEVMCL